MGTARLMPCYGESTLTDKNWDTQTDVLIIGSGAGALTAALRAHDHGDRVLVIEKTDYFGGTSAMSGGVLWLPNSPLIAAAGGSDSAEEGKRYMQSVIGEPELNARIDAFVDTVPEMVDYLHTRTHLRLDVLVNFPDMYPDNPDFKMYRCHEARPFHGGELGEDLMRMRPQHPQTQLYGLIGWTASESLALQARGKGWLRVAFSMVARYLLDIPWRVKSTRDRRQVLGGALVGSLRRSMIERGIPIELNSAADELLVDAGRVVGVTARRNGQKVRIGAAKAVIVASGGFEKNNAMRQQYMPAPTDAAWTAGSPGNTGEMIEAGCEIGARTGFMDEGWWGPTVTIPGEPQARMLVIEKNLPGCILVNKAGERFVNESSSYTKVIKGMLSANAPGRETVPAYLIFDSIYRKRYPMGPMLPSTFQPDWVLPRNVKQEIKKARSIRDLAGQLGVDADGLERQVQQFNDYARNGKDPQFKRGDAEYDRYYGDYQVTPNPCLGAIAKPPYYGVRVYPGELGTKGGLWTDDRARVLDQAGQVIEGLYAIGNCSASVMGRTYPASGSTLAPAMVFGFIAADSIAGKR